MKTTDDRPSSAERRAARERFATAARVEAEYVRALRGLTRQIDQMVRSMAQRDHQKLQQMLREYARTIQPWAESIAEKMTARVAKRDAMNWIAAGKSIGRRLREELETAPTGRLLEQLQREQVVLITSLPIEAAERVHHVAQQHLLSGIRSEALVRDILETGSVVESRARLIARTETARMASNLTQARAQHVGSTHYVWRTVGDSDTRSSHKAMNGKVIPWAREPEVEPGKFYHAGCFPHCRCYAEPIFTEV